MIAGRWTATAVTAKPRDRDGRVIREGDLVRIVGVPDLRNCPARTHRVFHHLVGTYRRVWGFDELGNAELVFRIRTGRDRGLHVVGIEPHLLSAPRRSSSQRKPSKQ
jgi:hypothetical protein